MFVMDGSQRSNAEVIGATKENSKWIRGFVRGMSSRIYQWADRPYDQVLPSTGLMYKFHAAIASFILLMEIVDDDVCILYVQTFESGARLL